MKKKTVLISVSVLLLTSCAEANNEPAQISVVNSSGYIAEYCDNYDEGRIVGGYYAGNGTPAKYLDYNTMKSVVLCSKPNCSHTTNDCIATNIGVCPLLTQDSIYFFKSNYDVKEEKNGSREFYIDSKLCKASLETSEIETITSFTDCAPSDTRGYVFYNNRIYFTADDMDPAVDEYGAFSYSNIGGIHYLCSIDLETGDYRNYGSVYDGDKEYPSAEASSSANIMGIYNGKLIVNYEFGESYEDLAAGVFTELMFEFDFDKNTITESDIPYKPVFLDSDTIVYYDEGTNKCVIIDENNKKEIDTDRVSYASIQNNKLFIRDDKNNYALKWYDLSDLSVHNAEGMNCYMPVHFCNDSYILTFGDDTKKISENELLSLDRK